MLTKNTSRKYFFLCKDVIAYARVTFWPDNQDKSKHKTSMGSKRLKQASKSFKLTDVCNWAVNL